MRSKLIIWLGCLLVATPLAIAPALSAAGGGGSAGGGSTGGGSKGSGSIGGGSMGSGSAGGAARAPRVVALSGAVIRSPLASDFWFGTRTSGNVSLSDKARLTMTASLKPVALWR